MNPKNTHLEFAECPLGHSTPIRPAMLYPVVGGPKWSIEDVPFVTVACSECMRVYSLETERLKERATQDGLSPYDPDSPIHAFLVKIECGAEGCETPLSVIAVRKRDTTAEQLEREKTQWTWENLTCPSGHAIPDRPEKK
jgi:hypothetical protein